MMNTIYPCAKINLGLNIVSKRTDGYHNLETVFYPIPLTDTLEITSVDTAHHNECVLSMNGAPLDCDPDKNLVVRAYQACTVDRQLPKVCVSLNKCIPSQAGMGGGSSDAAFMLRLLNDTLHLNYTRQQLIDKAAALGADCAFFIDASPAYATGIGEVLLPLPCVEKKLSGLHIGIVKPHIAISTRQAFSAIQPHAPAVCCREAVEQPVEEWKHLLSNDFEGSLFPQFPELQRIKDELYNQGAFYAQMSGSGSSLFGLFRTAPDTLAAIFPHYFTFTAAL